MVDEDEVNRLLDRLLQGRKPEDILGEGGLVNELTKRLMERVLGAQRTDPLGYEKAVWDGGNGGGWRNGRGAKPVRASRREIDLEALRRRDGMREPRSGPKIQRLPPGFDEKVIALYARGMATRDIQGHLKDVYHLEISPDLISTVTDTVFEEAQAWQRRPLDPSYPIVYLDSIQVKVQVGGHVRNETAYVALALTMEGDKELLGLWMGDEEGAKPWMSLLTELKNRGLHDILIASIDGLPGFPEAIANVYPETRVHLCVVHLVRGSLRFVTGKERRTIDRDLRAIYRAPTVVAAEQALDVFEARWDERFPMISRKWRTSWASLISFFDYPPEIRKMMCLTNAVESLNAQLQKVTRRRGALPTSDTARRMLHLAIMKASERWSRPVNDWAAALYHLSLVFPGRVLL